MNSKKAFTLIELLAVIVIIGIIATIGFYSINKILDNVRISALTDTALAVKKAANNHINTSDAIVWDNNMTTLDVTPGDEETDIPRGEHAYLVEIDKDPWGGQYRNIVVSVLRQDDAYEMDVYITNSKGDVYELTYNSSRARLLKFEFDPMVLASSMKTGEDKTMELYLSKAYGKPTIQECELFDSNSNPVTDETLYHCGELVGSNGNYTIDFRINKVGAYRFLLTYGAENQETTSQTTNIINVTNSTTVNMASSYTVDYGDTLTFSMNLTGNIPIATVKNEAGTSLVASPQLNTNYNISKLYTTVGNNDEQIVVTDIHNNVVVKNYTVNVLPPPPPTFSSILVKETITTPGAWLNTTRRIEFIMANPTALPITCTVQRWNGSAWVNVVADKAINAGTTYTVAEGSVLSEARTGLYYDSYHEYSDDPYYDDNYYYFRFRMIISNGATSTTSNAIDFTNTAFES